MLIDDKTKPRELAEHLEREYGVDSEPCRFCGGMTEGRGHRILRREDGSATRCQVGDLRAVARFLRGTGEASAHSLPVPGTTIVLHHYRLPSVNGEGWAIITIGSDGTFTALSDYGDWSYAGWSHHGCKDIREFFLRERRSDSYLVTKLCCGHPSLLHVYDGEETVKGIKRAIIEARRCRAWSAKKARDEWNILDDYEVIENREGFSRWYEHTQIDDAHEFCRSQPDPQCVAFVEKVLLSERFQAMLRDDLRRSAESVVRVDGV